MQRINPAREAQINALITELSGKFGIKPAIKLNGLVPLYNNRHYAALVREIRNSFGLNHLKVSIQYPERMKNPQTMAMIEKHGLISPIAAFPITKPAVTLYLSMTRLRHASFSNVVRTLAHELAHPMLWAEHHALKDSEFAVDITAMLFGYHHVFAEAHSDEEMLTQYGFPDMPELAGMKSMLARETNEEQELRNPAYLTSAEIRYTAEVIRRCIM